MERGLSITETRFQATNKLRNAPSVNSNALLKTNDIKNWIFTNLIPSIWMRHHSPFQAFDWYFDICTVYGERGRGRGGKFEFKSYIDLALNTKISLRANWARQGILQQIYIYSLDLIWLILAYFIFGPFHQSRVCTFYFCILLQLY